MSQIEELRQILVGENAEQLHELRKRINDLDVRSHDIAEVLPRAIVKGHRENENLSQALREPVSDSLKEVIQTEPTSFAEILYPVMAPSIRRAISQSISSLLSSINQTIESATTLEGLALRYQSFRTGVPYAELALRRSLVYRVEQVFLIERESGLMIAQESARDTAVLDSDAVSAMFSAIQSFVQDSFSQNKEDRLTDLKVGEHNVWVVHGPHAMLAAVIFGDAPASLKNQLYDVLDEIRTDYARALDEFDGDHTEAFDGISGYLRPLLQARLKGLDRKKERKTAYGKFAFYVIAALAALWWSFGYVEKFNNASVLNHYLDSTPGIVVTDINWEDGRMIVDGLKDPDAVVPYLALNAYGIEDHQIDLQMVPFRSLETAMEVQRFTSEFNLPESVSMGISDVGVMLDGEADLAWLLQYDNRLRQLQADKRLDISSLFSAKESVVDWITEHRPSLAEEQREELATLIATTPWAELDIDLLLK